MAAGDRIIIGVQIGLLYPQADDRFTEQEFGFDVGERKWLTHPDTPKSHWPQRGAPDAEWPFMTVREVSPRREESGLIELTAQYRGMLRAEGPGPFKERIISGSPVAMFSLPAISSGNPARLVAPIPKPTCTREYLTRTKPTLNGVSKTVSASFLPGLPDFLISYTPDPDEPLTLNYGSGWKLDDRSWEEVGEVWLVNEVFTYYYPLAV